MTLLLAINGGGSWSAERWRDRFQQALPHHNIVADGIDPFSAAEVRYAAVWKPAPGFLATLPKLEVIFNLGAGVDALLADATLPEVPVVRVVDPDLTARMTEYVTLHVLLHHRRLPQLLAAQSAKQWIPQQQWAASAVRVGIMGMGTLGSDAAAVLARLGFQVAGWSRTNKVMPNIEMFSGATGLVGFLRRTDILVALMPLTSDTSGILNQALFHQLARDGVLGAPVLINAGRGGLQVEADILSALNNGTLGAATLDVFATEPLQQTSELWTHPRVIVTPHNAADSDPDALASAIARQILDFKLGHPLRHVVDRLRGY